MPRKLHKHQFIRRGERNCCKRLRSANRIIKDLKEALRPGNMNKLWRQLNNPDFKPVEFDRFKNEAGANAFTLSPDRMPIEQMTSLAKYRKQTKHIENK